MPPPAPAPIPSDDQSLARAIANHDTGAFESLMRAHNRMLYRVARAILKDDSEAEDAVQEAYLAAFRTIANFRGDAKLATWLTRIVMNEAYARLRRRKREATVFPLSGADTPSSPSEPAMPFERESERPDALALRAEFRRLLERKLDGLPEQFRTAFMLREVEEMPVDEIAACLGVPEATVRTRAFRARALLRDALDREYDGATREMFGFAGQRCDRIVAKVLQRLQSAGHPDAPDARE